MLTLRIWIAAAALFMLLAAVANAHSLDEVETMLGDGEKYFQMIDKSAPDFTLQTADDRTTKLADLAGKVVVLNFLYTSCPDVCPLHAEKIAEVQQMINQTPMKDLVTFVTVTTDPVNDTAEVMNGYGPAHGLDPTNWLFLTKLQEQPENSTRELAEAFGHGFDKTEDGLQLHGIVTHVIDGEGRWRANFHGLKFQSINLITFVNALTNGAISEHRHESKSWWSKVSDFF